MKVPLDSTHSNSTIRIMNRAIGLLGYALLGLLQQKSASGYELRKIFTETPLGSFSDSPGAIYPALRRLEVGGFIRGKIEKASGLRQRKVLQITPTGLTELRTWLTQPVAHADVASRLNELMLRFAFLDTAAGEAATLEFLQSIEAALRSYIPTLKTFLKSHAAKMPRSGRLALESGILGYEAQFLWASRAIVNYKT
jgi:DNA-binding PadR family transcriptional regulator